MMESLAAWRTKSLAGDRRSDAAPRPPGTADMQLVVSGDTRVGPKVLARQAVPELGGFGSLDRAPETCWAPWPPDC